MPFRQRYFLYGEKASRLLRERPTVGSLLLGELFRASLNPFGEEILKTLILAMCPEEHAADQSNQTNSPSKNEVGLDVSHQTRTSPRGGEKILFLTSSLIG